MIKNKLTAEVRLYRWLKRKTTPEDAWRTMSLQQIAEKVKCSRSTVSRLLPGIVSQLKGCPLDEARQRCIEAHHLRSGRLVSEEIEILKKITTERPTCLLSNLRNDIWCLVVHYPEILQETRTWRQRNVIL